MTSCKQTTVGDAGGGYAFQLVDCATAGCSTACVDSSSLCGSGTTGIQNPPSYTIYGSGFGIDVSEGASAAAAKTPIMPNATGLTYTVDNLPTNGLQIVLSTPAFPSSAGPCYLIKPGGAATGTILWSSFNTKCYDATPDGTAFASTDGITGINFQVPASAAASTWSFCVTALSF
jgi:hypothetical protein